MYLEYTFFIKIVYSRHTKYHYGLPRRLNEECGEERSFGGVVAWLNSMVISCSWCCRQKQIDAIMIRIVLDWLEYDRIVLDTVKLAVFQGRKKSVFRDRCELSGSVLKWLDDKGLIQREGAGRNTRYRRAEIS